MLRESQHHDQRLGVRSHARRIAHATLLTIVGLLLVGNASCDRMDRPAAPQQSAERIKIAIVGPGLNDPCWPILAASAEWFNSIERDVEVVAMAPDVGSAIKQRAMVQSLQEGEHDAICVMPYDPKSMTSTIRDIVQYGKIVVTVGHDVPNSLRIGYCGPLEMEIGRSAVIACTKVLEGRPKTVMLLHGGRQDAEGQRLVGFESEVRKFQDIQVLKELNCKNNAPDALHMVRLETRKYPRTGCWVFLDDWAYRALPPGDRLLPLGNGIVMCNSSSEYFRLVDNGQVLAMITYNLRKAVDSALFLATEAAEAKNRSSIPVSRNVYIECDIVTDKNMSEHRKNWLNWSRPDYREMP